MVSATRRAALGGLVALAIVAIGGAWHLAQRDRAAPVPAASAIELRGARIVEDGVPRFDRERRPLLIVDGADAPPLAAHISTPTGRTSLTLRPYPVDGGWRFETGPLASEPPAGSARLRVVTGEALVLDRPIRWAPPPSDVPGLDRIATARAAGDVPGARRAIAAIATPDAEQALWLPVERARVALMAGDLPAAEAEWRAGAQLAAERRLVGEQARRLNAAAYIALNRRDFVAMDRLTADALALLDSVDDPANRANVLHMRGVLALETGAWRAASARFDEAVALARRLGLRRVARLVIESQALALGALGRYPAALATLDGVRDMLDDAPAADRSRYHVNVGWLRLGAGEPDRARRAFETALVDARRPDRRANIELNLAHAALAMRDRDAAGRHLDAAIAQGAERTHGLTVQMLRAQRLLAHDQPAAARLFADVEARARAELGPGGGDVAWRALHGRGRALRGADPATAAAVFDRALADMARQGTRTGLLGPRGAFFEARRALVADAVDLALDRGDTSRAFGIADRDRARVLRAARTRLRVQRLTGEARTRWLARAGDLAVARDRLAALRRKADLVAGEARARWATDVRDAEATRRAAFEAAVALLDRDAPVERGVDGSNGDRIVARLAPDAWLFATMPVGSGWRSFRVTGAGIEHRAVGDDPLGPWRAALHAEDGPDHVYVVSGGHPQGFAAATAPYGEREPLLSSHTVAWLPFAGLILRPPATADGPPAIIADPGLDLPHARAAGRALAETLPGATLLVGRSATAEALRAALPSTRLLHFAGHGVLREARPWDAHLRLAGGRRFDVVDVLGQRMNGGRVVLNGCETGPEALLSRDDVLGLPEAFLAAGATSVVATDRPVPDAAARDFTERFYAAGGLTDPAGALRVVARHQRLAGRATWSAWRLLGVR